MIQGTLIVESLRANAALDQVPLVVHRIERVGPLTDLAPNQPSVWTFVEFTAGDADAAALADSLATALDEPGWYCDFRTSSETFVVFAGRVVRYERGDAEGRARAADLAASVGVPPSQIDWPD